MTPNKVKSKILEKFDCGNFSLLECFKGRLNKAKHKVLTAQIAIATRGALYLCQKQKVSELALGKYPHTCTSDIQYVYSVCIFNRRYKRYKSLLALLVPNDQGR